MAGAQPKPGSCAVVVVGGDGPAARRACGKRSRGVPHTRTVGSGRGGDRPASQLAVSGRSSRGLFGNGRTIGRVAKPKKERSEAQRQALEKARGAASKARAENTEIRQKQRAIAAAAKEKERAERLKQVEREYAAAFGGPSEEPEEPEEEEVVVHAAAPKRKRKIVVREASDGEDEIEVVLPKQKAPKRARRRQLPRSAITRRRCGACLSTVFKHQSSPARPRRDRTRRDADGLDARAARAQEAHLEQHA